MGLITRSDDERLKRDDHSAYIPGVGNVLLPSLRAALAAKEKAEGALCRAREAIRSKVIDALNRHRAPMEACQDVVDSIDAALSSSSPCPHAAELERVKEALAEHDIIVTIFPGGGIQIEQGKPPAPYIQTREAHAALAGEEGK